MSTQSNTKRKNARAVEVYDEGMPPPNKVICACSGMTFERLEAAVSELQNHGFEALQAETGAGQTCTACLLDLEYYFVALKARDAKSSTVQRNGGAEQSVENKSLKYKLYDWLDSVSPPVAWSVPNRIPILAGDGIETWLTVTNHDLLFDQRKSAPLTTKVAVYRADGKQVREEKHRILPGEELRLRIDEEVRDGPGELMAGSARVISRADYPAMRGTMRPQLEVLATGGACALHAQGDVGPGDTWFTAQDRPEQERLFLLLMNIDSKPQTANISYPHSFNSTEPVPDKSVDLTVPAHGTGLHEIKLTPGSTRRLNGGPYSSLTRCPGPCRVYLICATPNLDCFSIDHR